MSIRRGNPPKADRAIMYSDEAVTDKHGEKIGNLFDGD